MYVLLFSNSDLEDHLYYIHRGTLNFRTNINYIKTIKKQTGILNIILLREALENGLEKYLYMITVFINLWFFQKINI